MSVPRLPLMMLGVLGLLVAAGCDLTHSAVDDYLAGQLAAEKGNMDKAVADLTQAIDKNPKMGLAYMSRGEIYKARGDYTQAAGDFEHVTKIEPFNFDAFYNLGLMYQYLKRFDDSIRAYQKAVEIRPLDAQANMNLALVYTQMDQPLRGLGYAQRAVTGDDTSALTHANLGVLYAQLGYSELAIDELGKAIELGSKEPQVYLALSAEYLTLEKITPARNVLDNGRKTCPTPALLERLGYCYYKSGDLEAARTAYEQSLKLDETYFRALNGLGAVAMVQSLKSTPADTSLARQALAYWRRSVRLEPDQPRIKDLITKYAGQADSGQATQP
jgi:tetratricopeptide (TPR) repeat protein